MDIRPGSKIRGPNGQEFTVGAPLGNGAFGIVYEATGPAGERVAVKTLTTAWLPSTELTAMLNEGRLATSVQHPNVVRVLHFDDGSQQAGAPPYMMMEFVAGGTLAEMIAAKGSTGTAFSESELRAFFAQLAEGMKAINAKLVHRDLKPDNILLDPAAGTLKIGDFGLAKLAGAATRSSTLKGINHVMYTAPEAWQNQANTPAMDMYAMGIVFFELATLQHPYRVNPSADPLDAWRRAHLAQTPADPRALNPALPRDLAQLIMKMMAKRPEDRCRDWDEVLTRVRNPAAGAPSSGAADVGPLVERALQRHRESEQARGEAERRRQEAEERLAMVTHAFADEVVRPIEEVVAAFNAQSAFARLEIIKDGQRRLRIRSRPDDKELVVEIGQPVDVGVGQTPLRRARALGTVSAPSRAGFNLVLMAQNLADLYGRWAALYFERNPLTAGPFEGPREFPLLPAVLTHELELFGAMTMYQHREVPFSADLLLPLLEELI